MYGKIKSDALVDILQDSYSTDYLKKSRERSGVFAFLNELELAEDWSNANYRLIGDSEDIEMFKKRYSALESRSTDEVELVAYLQLEAEKQGKSPSASGLRDVEDAPSPSTYQTRFGEWNSALWHAGLDIFKETYDKEDIQDSLRRQYHELGRIPTAREFDRGEMTPSRKAVRTDFDNYMDLVESTFSAAELTEDENVDRWMSEMDEEIFEKVELPPALTANATD